MKDVKRYTKNLYSLLGLRQYRLYGGSLGIGLLPLSKYLKLCGIGKFTTYWLITSSWQTLSLTRIPHFQCGLSSSRLSYISAFSTEHYSAYFKRLMRNTAACLESWSWKLLWLWREDCTPLKYLVMTKFRYMKISRGMLVFIELSNWSAGISWSPNFYTPFIRK